MGINKIIFDYDIIYQDCSKDEINDMIKLNTIKEIDIEIDDGHLTEIKNILNDIGEPEKSKSEIVKSNSNVDILHDYYKKKIIRELRFVIIKCMNCNNIN